MIFDELAIAAPDDRSRFLPEQYDLDLALASPLTLSKQEA